MKREETLAVADAAISILAQLMEIHGDKLSTEDGQEDVIGVYNPFVLRATILKGLKTYDESIALIDTIDEENPDQKVASEAVFGVIHGAMSILGAAMIIVETSAIPFEMVMRGIKAEMVAPDIIN